jgi:hypothetical protein
MSYSDDYGVIVPFLPGQFSVNVDLKVFDSLTPLDLAAFLALRKSKCERSGLNEPCKVRLLSLDLRIYLLLTPHI